MAKKHREAQGMVTTKFDFETHTALRLLHARLRKSKSERLTMSDALKAYITEHDPEIMTEAKEIAAMREQIAQRMGGDE